MCPSLLDICDSLLGQEIQVMHFLSSSYFSHRNIEPTNALNVALAFVFAIFLAAGLASQVEAQTPTTTIQNSSDASVLQLNYDGGLVVSGYFNPTSPADSIPTAGAGTRMMWYPAKSAFRAGRVWGDKGDVWDADSIGLYSVALGVGTKGNGAAATAMGNMTTASGTAATAMGDGTTASGGDATAMGSGTVASNSQSTAMGRDTEASGTRSTAMGFETTATGSNATAMGFQTTAASNNSLSIGLYNSANTSSDGSLLVAGNGTSDSPSDAMVLEDTGNLTISGSLTESSDRRLKTKVEPLSRNVLEALAEIRPVRFQFKEGTGHPTEKQIGLIAQEVQKAFPGLVNKGSEGYLSLAYPKLSAVLLKGIQEQQAKIEQQQAKIESLGERVRQVEDLQKRIARLEKRSRSNSVLAGLPGSKLLLAFLLGSLLGAGLIWHRRK